MIKLLENFGHGTFLWSSTIADSDALWPSLNRNDLHCENPKSRKIQTYFPSSWKMDFSVFQTSLFSF